jgi:hypothetical protein
MVFRIGDDRRRRREPTDFENVAVYDLNHGVGKSVADV